MKSLLALLLTTTLILSGCTTQPMTPVPESTSVPEPSSASEVEQPQMTDSQRERYTLALNELHISNNSIFTTNWSGTPILTDNGLASGLEIIDAAPADDGLVSLTVELFGNLYLDPATMQESTYGEVPILTTGLPYSPQIAIGKSTVELRDTAGGKVEVLSCSYQPYPSPGITYLKEHAAKNPPPADSPKLDVSKYDDNFVRFIWRKLLQTRYIASPADITHADLAGMTGNIDIDWSAQSQNGDPVDASLLRLMPKLTSISCHIPLTDYSVFAGMNELSELRLSGVNDAQISTLSVGHTNKLHLDDPDCDVLDLTNVNVDTLSMMSYSTAVRGFAGCERVKNLYINSTRTDMRLVNATAFPNVEYLNLQFYSDFERVRDLSQLATFPDDTVVDVMLTYMACNSMTVETLAGVKPRLLMLAYGDRPAPSEEVVAAVGADRTIVGDTYNFTERTKDSVD